MLKSIILLSKNSFLYCSYVYRCVAKFNSARYIKDFFEFMLGHLRGSLTENIAGLSSVGAIYFNITHNVILVKYVSARKLNIITNSEPFDQCFRESLIRVHAFFT